MNKLEEIGLETGICSKCGAVSRTNSLSDIVMSRHFENDWLVRHSKAPKRDDLVYEKISSFLSFKEGRVLDIGCGNGSYLMAFKDAGFTTFGVEPSRLRASQAEIVLPNIFNMTGEEFLANTNENFEVAYLFDVMQFTRDPLTLISQVSKKLSSGGLLWWKFGKFFKRSNILQFGHYAVLQNYFNLATIKPHLISLGLEIVSHNEEPFELLLRKVEKPSEPNHSIGQWTISDMEKYAKQSIGYLRAKYLGKSSVSYLNREFRYKFLSEDKNFKCIEFVHDGLGLPVLLK